MNQFGPSWQRSARDTDILARYAAGESLSSIASIHKISAERVRQIARAQAKSECSTLGTGPLEPEIIS